ncbi:hypothetical protein BKH43_05550 [Helicobacter sp. 13S00401-1]|uniref:hypothetical protein n=1 Tax=Helicobacter sp. 13S00401-1 TaxID=1905758 RepID=UPI000BA7AC0D|nr:hypothetical protein [Helicobacter sp. 13S00401-1]PAF50200.1 hypothetical protein BKH43_05550 [Helicobacter sp. 13S00401-1]
MKLVIMIIGCIVFLTGCVSLSLQPAKISSYDSGIKIYQDSKPTSKIQIELAQEKVGGFNTTPLVLYITAESKDTQNTFDMSNISFYMNDKEVFPLTYSELKKESLDLSDVAYDYGIYIKPQSANKIMIANELHSGEPTYVPLRPHGIHAFSIKYAPNSYVASKQDLQARLNQNARAKTNALIYKSYLKKDTPYKGSIQGGFVLIPYKELKPGILRVIVKVGDDAYSTQIKLLNASR